MDAPAISEHGRNDALLWVAALFRRFGFSFSNFFESSTTNTNPVQSELVRKQTKPKFRDRYDRRGELLFGDRFRQFGDPTPWLNLA
jgi:hypothetical protein